MALSTRRTAAVAGCGSAVAALAVVASAVLAGTANAATTTTVAADGSGDYTTIQAAVAAASRH